MALAALNTVVTPALFESRKLLFTIFFFALSAIALTLWQGASLIAGSHQSNELKNEAIFNKLKSVEQISAQLLASNILPLSVIAKTPTIENFIEAPTAHTEAVRRMFAVLIESSPNIYQIRYIDRNGMETIRIDKLNNSLVYTPKNELQDKSTRPYFIDTIKLQKDEFNVSNLNLNREHGVVQTPWVPTIRISTALFDKNNIATGILVININAQPILDLYNNLNSESNKNVTLVSANGDWLTGREKGQLWGSDTNSNQGFDHEFANAWVTLTQHKQSKTAEGTIGFLSRAATIQSLLPHSLKYGNSNKVLWYAVEQVSVKGLGSQLLMYLPIILIVFCLSVFSWSWAKNVIEKHNAEKELVKSEKLSSLGGLVAGVAHELNTPIGSAITIASTVETKSNALQKQINSGQVNKSQLVEFIVDMQRAGEMIMCGLDRASGLIGQFKQIAVDQAGEQQRTFALDTYITEMCATINHLFKRRKVELELNLNSGVLLFSYPGSISQVLINLIQNALVHGFNEADAGKITVATSVSPDGYVIITVSDNGKGIPPQITNKIFDPFFTTKLGHGGSGLGLHISHNIATNILCGSLTVSSTKEPQLTTFCLRIPSTAIEKPIANEDQGQKHGKRFAA